MESRKIIKFGNSSHVISLPKDWMKKIGLNKGDTLYLNDLGNGELIVGSSDVKKEKQNQYSIDFPLNSDCEDKIQREIFHAYINNFKIIKISGPGVRNNALKIRDFIQGLSGLEIFKQTPNEIVAHDLLDVSEISLSQMMRRIDIICRSMMRDTIDSIIDKKEDYNNIYKRDDDLNRLVYLSYKLIKNAFNNPSFAKKMDVTHTDLTDYKVVAQNLERLADQCKRISRDLSRAELNKKDKRLLKELYLTIEQDYLRVIKAYYNKDREMAHKVIDSVYSIVDRFDSLIPKVSSHNSILIIEKLRISEVCIRQIGRVILKIA